MGGVDPRLLEILVCPLCKGKLVYRKEASELVCRAEVDRRNRTSAVLRATVEHADGRLIATAVGSYLIFATKRPRPEPPS